MPTLSRIYFVLKQYACRPDYSTHIAPRARAQVLGIARFGRAQPVGSGAGVERRSKLQIRLALTGVLLGTMPSPAAAQKKEQKEPPKLPDNVELLRDVEIPSRYLIIDRWESAEAYNAFASEHRDEYMSRVRMSLPSVSVPNT